jgi:two-component system, OmpR family, response regulator RegX3
MTRADERRRHRVLVVEDEPGLAESVRYALDVEGFDVLVADSGVGGLESARVNQPDLVLLDLMLPGMSGLDVCRQIRLSSDVPIIMLTAKDAESDKVAGLELGADDYMTKPFSMRELVARIRAQLRRATKSGVLAESNEVLRGGPIELDIDAHQTRVDGEPVDLRPKEFELLESLMRRRNRLAPRHTLIDEVWGPSYFGDTKTLDVHIKRLRQKLEPDPSHPRLIVTVRGLGYKFVDEQ